MQAHLSNVLGKEDKGGSKPLAVMGPDMQVRFQLTRFLLEF